MQSSIVFQSKKGNHYLFDANRKRIMLVHPALFSIIKEQETVQPGSALKNEYKEYHLKKIDYLKQHGWFNGFDQQERLKGRVAAQRIEYELANLKQLTFEVTDACNLKCKYCGYGEFYGDYDKRTSRRMKFEIAKSVIDYLYELWKSPLNVSTDKKIYISFYGGEPLMNMSLIRSVVDYISRLNLPNKFAFSMTTNATLLHRHIDFLVEHDFQLLISLDGNEKHNSYRVDHSGNPVFDKIIKNILSVRKKYSDYFTRQIFFNSVLHNRNSVAEILDFFKEKFDRKPMISELNNMGIRTDKIEEFQQLYRNKLENLMQSENYTELEKEVFLGLSNYQALLFFLIKYSSLSYQTYNDLFAPSPKTNYKLPTGTCYPFGKKMFVTVNGKILACERIGQQFGLGQVKNNIVHIDLEHIARKYNDYYDRLRQQCSVCYFSETCMQCIFNLKDIDKRPICHGFMNRDNFTAYLTANVSLLEKDNSAYNKMFDVAID